MGRPTNYLPDKQSEMTFIRTIYAKMYYAVKKYLIHFVRNIDIWTILPKYPEYRAIVSKINNRNAKSLTDNFIHYVIVMKSRARGLILS